MNELDPTVPEFAQQRYEPGDRVMRAVLNRFGIFEGGYLRGTITEVVVRNMGNVTHPVYLYTVQWDGGSLGRGYMSNGLQPEV